MIYVLQTAAPIPGKHADVILY